MLPPVEKFVARVRRMGIGDGHRVVVYDQQGIYSAARVWWMFRVFGHKDVAVLDGGLPKWLAEGRPVETRGARPARAAFHRPAQRRAGARRDAGGPRGQAAATSRSSTRARPGRFRGEEAEPRKGLRSGHMPGAKNVHFRTLLNDDQTMKSPDELRAIFEAARRRSREAGRHDLRLGRDGGDRQPGAGAARPQPQRRL